MSQNNANVPRHKDNATGYKGVMFSGDTKRKKPYAAQIAVNGKRICIGRYATAEEAHKAYCEAAKRHHGEFSRTE